MNTVSCTDLQEFLGISIARSVTVRAVRFTEVSTLNPMDIEPILDIHVGLKRRLQRYGVLKQDMERMMESESVDEFVMEQMKQRIEDTFEDSEESELKGAQASIGALVRVPFSS
jgi:hypothetical protein|eukprot:COSAG02_NODE_6916_length_3291_cov_1.183271_2_plen_114_part_00